MNLLGNVLYDPAVAVTKGTAASVLAAFDTTNARIAFVVPPSGCVRVVMQVTIHGAATFSQIVLGVLEGATLRGRVTPIGSLNGTALATTMMTQNVDYIVSGLTPGASVNWDAAWGIETFVANSLIKYGGPNNTTANDAFGALVFQLWDPAPIYTPTSGTAPTIPISTRLDTVDDFIDTEVAAIKTTTDKFVFTGANKVDASVRDWVGDTIPARNVAGVPIVDLKYTLGTISPATAGSVRADAVTGAVGSVTAGVTLAASAVQAIWDALTSALTTAGSIGKLLVDNINATISSRLATAGYTAPLSAGATANAVWDELNASHVGVGSTGLNQSLGAVAGLDAAGVRSAVGLASANLDTQLAAIAGYIDTEVASILSSVGTLTVAERNSIADAVLARNVAGGSSAGRTIAQALAFLRNKWTLAGGTLTVYDTDDTSVLWTAAVTQTAGADPVTASDPA